MVKSIVSMQNADEMGKAEKVKMITGIVIGVAADMAVTTMLKTHLPVLRGWRKLMIGIGAFIIGMKIGEDCENYFYKVWDDTKTSLKEAKNELEQIGKEVPAEGSVQ